MFKKKTWPSHLCVLIILTHICAKRKPHALAFTSNKNKPHYSHAHARPAPYSLCICQIKNSAQLKRDNPYPTMLSAKTEKKIWINKIWKFVRFTCERSGTGGRYNNENKCLAAHTYTYTRIYYCAVCTRRVGFVRVFVAIYLPENPSGQLQLYWATPSMQMPPLTHGDDQHSSQLVWHCTPV